MSEDLEQQAILATFIAEAETLLNQMEEGFVRLESTPDDQELLGSIFRFAHTMKGNSSILGFNRLVEVSHEMENLLQRLRDHKIKVTNPLVSLLLQSVDVLRQLLADAVGGVEEVSPEQKDLLRRLVEFNGSFSAPKEEKIVREEQQPERNMGRRREDQPNWQEQNKSLRVGIEKLDRMLNLTGELVISRERMKQILNKVGDQYGDALIEAFRQQDHIYSELQENILKIRMVPLGPVFRQYIRTVRDASQSLNKIARLHLEGMDVEVDTTVVEHLRDPLTHIVRNAIGHAIESPEVRKSRGKDPCGNLTLRAFHESGNVVIQIIDDGAGFNRKKIIEKASKFRDPAELERLPDEEIYELVFEAGFSTMDEVTELAGRGVGMDVVKRNVQLLRGSIRIESEEGKGSTISIRLPLTLAIIEGFVVSVGEDQFVVPLDVVTECMDFPEDERVQNKPVGVISLRGQALSYVRLRNHFSIHALNPKKEKIVVVRVGNKEAGLAVDQLIGSSRAVIKPLGDLFQNLPGIAGSTILGTGRVALILDVPGLMRGLNAL